MIVTSRGWWDLEDVEAFYPGDLPSDWRLGYFANQFGATLLPWSRWARTNEAEWSQWADDVTPNFQFVAERGSEARAESKHRSLQLALGNALSAWLAADERLDAQQDHYEHAETHQLACWNASARAPVEPNQAAADGYAAVAPSALHRDLRGARHWLEELCRCNKQPPAVVILARPASESLVAWHELIELLGLDRS